MNPKINKILSILLVFLFALSGSILSKDKKDNSLNKVKGTGNITGVPSKTRFNINSISTIIVNNGDSDKNGNASGFIYPKGSNNAAIYESGLIWGGTIAGEKRVGGSTYYQGLLPGRIIGSGATAVREDETLPHVRIYRVRRDYAADNADFSSEVNDGEGSEKDIKAQYEKDWNEWPAQYGAPYEDVDNSGSYEPTKDIPGVKGADQTIWYVANDLDTATCTAMYGSNPMGIEMQATFWGYNQTNALGNMMFRKYVIINKSTESFDSMYVSMWTDPDIGNATDDFSGCDVDLSLMYSYNGNANDAVYGLTPPAAGFDFFQGPIVPAEGETAIFNGKYKKGYKNLPMSAHYFFINGDDVFNDPSHGSYTEGTLWFHNLFRGRISSTGKQFIDPNTGKATKFTLSGNPATGAGWVDGQLHNPDDRRQGMVAGPFTMAVGDTQEVVVAEIAAGAFGNVDRIGAVQLLKFYDLVAQNTYDNFFKVPSPVKQPVVSTSELNNEVVLKWEEDSEVENYKSNSYEFQGYVVYQFPSKSASFKDAKVIAIYDKKDGIGSIFGSDFDTESGAVLVKLLKKGGDLGIKRYISLKKDAFKSGKPLNNGSPYYFAVTAYAVNPKDLTVVPTVLESSPVRFEVIPQATGAGYSEPITHASDVKVTHNGSADASVVIKAIEPFEITGDEYRVSFKQQHYYQDKDGIWKETNYPDSVGKRLSKDVSPSSLSGVAIYSPTIGTIDLKYSLDLKSPTGAWVDGIEITLPAGVTINSIKPTHSNKSGNKIDFVQTGNKIFWGRKDTTKGGEHSFTGGELLEINVQTFTLPMTTSYIIYDDGYKAEGNPINAVGNVVVKKYAYNFRTENQWNLTNSTTGKLLLEKQRVFNGINQYASFWNAPVFVGTDAAHIVDGFQVELNGSFAAPVQLGSWKLTTGTGSYKIDDYGSNGWATTARSADAFGNGVTSIDELQKDYELRFTGVYEEKDANGLVYIKDGTGSIATIYHARGMDGIGVHPMNPNPGSKDPFLVRIPFEVWNIDDNRQVNLIILDRKQKADANPFYAFNPANRMYCFINNTAYDPTTINSGKSSNSDTDSLTWNLVFWNTDWKKDDIIKLNYDNPIQIGKDTFTFKTNNVQYSKDQAKIDIEKINVFPNPYYGVNPNEINKYQRYVTFNHLPPKATIRIFNLAGQLVKTINKDDSSQFARWTLTNENGLPVASGMYIVHIDMPNLEESKILKVAIIQETQILDRF